MQAMEIDSRSTEHPPTTNSITDNIFFFFKNAPCGLYKKGSRLFSVTHRFTEGGWVAARLIFISKIYFFRILEKTNNSKACMYI